MPEVHFLEAGFWRYLFGVIFLLIVGYKQVPSWRIIKDNLTGIFSIGSIALFSFNIFFFIGMKETSGVNGALIQGLNPALTVLLSALLLKTKIKWNHTLGILIAFSGVLLLILQGDLSSLLVFQVNQGDLFVFIAVNLFALHHVWVKKYSHDTFNNTPMAISVALMTLTCFTFTLPLSDFQPLNTHSPSFWIGVVGIGFFGSGVSYILWYKGVHELGANKAAVYVNLVPLSAGVSSSLFGESLQTYHFLSGSLIISGLLIMQARSRIT